MSKPTIKQIEYFLCIAENGSIRKAAQMMGITQPTVTTQIAQLEEQWGTRLLERTSTGTQPSITGRQLIPHMKLLLSQYQQICSLAQDISQTPSGTHKVGVPDTFGPYLLPEIIPELHRIFPSIRFFVREDTPDQLECDLQQGIYDFILTPLPVEINGLKTELLFHESLHLIAAPDHPLTQKSKVMPEHLQGDKFLVINEKHRFFREIMNLAGSLGLELMRDYAGTSLDTLRLMIGTGMGLSFLPALYVRSEIQHRQDVVSLDLGFKLPQRQIAMVWREHTPQKHLYKKITEVIREVASNQLVGVVDVVD